MALIRNNISINWNANANFCEAGLQTSVDSQEE